MLLPWGWGRGFKPDFRIIFLNARFFLGIVVYTLISMKFFKIPRGFKRISSKTPVRCRKTKALPVKGEG
jgi:hypothetical protein